MMLQLGDEASADMMFRNSEWGPEANKSMLDEIYNFPIKNGGILGDLIEATDKDLISKVYVEEKLFQTWNHGRVALMGDGNGITCSWLDAFASSHGATPLTTSSFLYFRHVFWCCTAVHKVNLNCA